MRPPAVYSRGCYTPLIKELDDSSYNIVYGCDAVPRGLGMLTYLAGFFETVLPEVLARISRKPENGVLNTLPLFGILLNSIGENEINDDDDVPKLDNVTKKLKNSGLTTVMRQFTHIGTVVYKKGGPFSSYEYLKGNGNISGTLDQAWPWTKTPKFPIVAAATNLFELEAAHAYYEKFEFDK